MSLTRVASRNVVSTVTEEVDGEEVTREVIDVVVETVDLSPEEEAAVRAEWAAERKPMLLTAIADKTEAMFAAGYFPPSGALQGESLQCRNEIDRTNWLTSLLEYSAAISQGAGAVEGATFRTTANNTVQLTYTEGQAVLFAMAGWGKAIYANAWALKDAITSAADDAALDAIDITAGWPS